MFSLSSQAKQSCSLSQHSSSLCPPLYRGTVRPPPFNRQAKQWVMQQWKWQQIITWSNTGKTFKSMKSFAGLLCATPTTSPLPLTLKSSDSTDLTSCVTELKSHRLAIDRHNSFGRERREGGKLWWIQLYMFSVKEKNRKKVRFSIPQLL